MLVTTCTDELPRTQDFLPSQELVRSKRHAKSERRRLKELARISDDRVLDPWERYRALNDHCKNLLDLTELYDRKTRFALLILGALNAINLLIVARLDVLSSLERGSLIVGGYVACYALLSLCLLMDAISALRPRVSHESPENGARAIEGQSLRLTNSGPRPTIDAYYEQWRQARIGQVNRELASAAHAETETNAVKVRALHRVYSGLYILAVLTAAFFVTLSLSAI